MKIELTINQKDYQWVVDSSDTELKVLRKHGFFGAKFGGCKEGECGACTVLFDGKPVNSCSLLAVQADKHSPPMGIDIKAETSEEIAVSIMAEIIQIQQTRNKSQTS